jgi:hypothetical protein
LLTALAALSAAACGGKAPARTGGGGDAAPGGGPVEPVTGGKEAGASDFIYEIKWSGDAVIITGYQKDAAGGNVVIPAAIEGLPVVAVNTSNAPYGTGFDQSLGYLDNKLNWLSDARVRAKGLTPYITSMVFPDTITEIQGGTYVLNLGKLTSVVLPKNLKEIAENFTGGGGELSSIKWPETLEIIGEGAFDDSGFTELVIPEGVKEIRDRAFWGCKKLTSVTLPGSVERIGDLAFADCPLLAAVTMPAKTIQYGTYHDLWQGFEKGWQSGVNGAFRGNPKLTGAAVRKAITDTGYTGGF